MLNVPMFSKASVLQNHKLKTLGWLGLFLLVLPTPALAQNDQLDSIRTTGFPDVGSAAWAIDSIESLNERYACIEGFPDGSFRGEDSLTRYQFVAGLYACMNSYDTLVQEQIDQLVTKEDLAILFRALSNLFEQNPPPNLNRDTGRENGLEPDGLPESPNDSESSREEDG